MILGKLKEKQENSQERSVTMVPETRNTNRSGWFPAQLRAITERKPTSLCFPILRQSFLPSFLPNAAFKPGISRDPTTQSRSQHTDILFSRVFRSRSQSMSHSECYEEGLFLSILWYRNLAEIFPRKLANPKSRVQTNVGRVSEIWLRTTQGFQVGSQLEYY